MDTKLIKFLSTNNGSKSELVFENNVVVKKCESWEDFKDQISKLEKVRSEISPADFMEKLFGETLYRGQRDSDWALKTTLERMAPEYLKVSKYYLLLSAIHRHIVTCGITGIPNVVSGLDAIEKAIKEEYPLPSLALLIFLRHLGFPSPLLDWTRSPFVAAFFAFKDCKSKDVAIYAFLERSVKSTMSTIDNPDRIVEMRVIGEYVVTHKRHFLQQSNYTLCLARECGSHIAQEFAAYEAHLANNGEDFPEAIIIKFIIPGSEKNIALRELDKMNINAYSLFGSEEGLMETLFNREALFKRGSPD